MRNDIIVVNARFLTQKVTGVQRYAIEISRQLKKLYGQDVIFVCPKNILNKEIALELEAKEVGSHHGHLWEQWDLPLYLRMIGSPLLLNLTNTAPIFYYNKLVTLHDILFVRYPHTFSKMFVAFYRVLIPLVVYTSKHLFTVSDFSKKEISDYYHIDKNKVTVIYNAVSSVFKNLYDATLRHKKYFMAVSSIKQNKNFFYILDAFLQLSAKDKQIELIVIGDLQSKSFQTMDLSKYKNKQIKFLGRVNDEELVRYYSNATAFIFPSLYEGFGIPPLEAQACGCPAICANTSCLPEIFGGSVLYCDPYDVSTLVKAMKKMIEDDNLRGRTIELGYCNIQRYSWEVSGIQMKMVIEGFRK